jgi:hypothetical protein
MLHRRSKQLIRAIILVAVVVSGFILVSAAIRYNHGAGLFDAAEQKSQSGYRPVVQGPRFVLPTKEL